MPAATANCETKTACGRRVIASAGSTMDDIVKQVRHVSDLIGEISSSSMEQSTGIGQIGDSLPQQKLDTDERL